MTEQDLDKQIGLAIRQARNLLNMSQKTLAEASGITFQQVQKYEKGVNRVSASRFITFCNILKIQPGYILDQISGGDNQDILSVNQVKMLRVFKRVPMQLQFKAIDIINAMGK